MAKSPGVEQFNHLNDKSRLFLFMLEEEFKTLKTLRQEVAALRKENVRQQTINASLISRAEGLKLKRSQIDSKADLLLKALSDAKIS